MFPEDDVLSGLTVALAKLVPEAVAFAFVAGVAPLVGLYAAFIVGLVTALIGGRPRDDFRRYRRSGCGVRFVGGRAWCRLSFSHRGSHGGDPRSLIGWLRLGKFIRLVPHPVMLGFVNRACHRDFSGTVTSVHDRPHHRAPTGRLHWDKHDLYLTCGLVLLTMAIIHFLPKLTKAIPTGALAVVCVALVADLHWPDPDPIHHPAEPVSGPFS